MIQLATCSTAPVGVELCPPRVRSPRFRILEGSVSALVSGFLPVRGHATIDQNREHFIGSLAGARQTLLERGAGQLLLGWACRIDALSRFGLPSRRESFTQARVRLSYRHKPLGACLLGRLICPGLDPKAHSRWLTR